MSHVKIPLARPDITELERRAVLDVLESPFLSCGPKVEEFERALAAQVGVRHGVAVNSGTSALQLAVRALGITAGDEVITTPFSFIASANCIVLEGARPRFVDIDPHTYNMNPELIEPALSKRTKALLGVDVFGRCAEWPHIREVASQAGLGLIEDACEALGAQLDGRQAGSFGDVGCFGFYPNKQMTTGEGGMIVTDRDDLAGLCRSLRNQGREEGSPWLVHRRVGFNFRMSDIQCALGLAQLARLHDMLERRAAVSALYEERLRSLEGLVHPLPQERGKGSWFVYIVRLADRFTREDRDRVLSGLREAGVGCAHYFPVIHLQEYYATTYGYRVGDFPVAEAVADRTLALPFFNALTASQVDEVVDNLVHQLRRLGR